MSKEEAEQRNVIKLLRTKDDAKLLEGLKKSEGEDILIRDKGGLLPIMLLIINQSTEEVLKAAIKVMALYFTSEKEGRENTSSFLKEGTKKSSKWRVTEWLLPLLTSTVEDILIDTLKIFSAVYRFIDDLPSITDLTKLAYFKVIMEETKPANALAPFITHSNAVVSREALRSLYFLARGYVNPHLETKEIKSECSNILRSLLDIEKTVTNLVEIVKKDANNIFASTILHGMASIGTGSSLIYACDESLTSTINFLSAGAETLQKFSTAPTDMDIFFHFNGKTLLACLLLKYVFVGKEANDDGAAKFSAVVKAIMTGLVSIKNIKGVEFCTLSVLSQIESLVSVFPTAHSVLLKNNIASHLLPFIEFQNIEIRDNACAIVLKLLGLERETGKLKAGATSTPQPAETSFLPLREIKKTLDETNDRDLALRLVNILVFLCAVNANMEPLAETGLTISLVRIIHTPASNDKSNISSVEPVALTTDLVIKCSNCLIKMVQNCKRSLIEMGVEAKLLLPSSEEITKLGGTCIDIIMNAAISERFAGGMPMLTSSFTASGRALSRRASLNVISASARLRRSSVSPRTSVSSKSINTLQLTGDDIRATILQLVAVIAEAGKNSSFGGETNEEVKNESNKDAGDKGKTVAAVAAKAPPVKTDTKSVAANAKGGKAEAVVVAKKGAPEESAPTTGFIFPIEGLSTDLASKSIFNHTKSLLKVITLTSATDLKTSLGALRILNNLPKLKDGRESIIKNIDSSLTELKLQDLSNLEEAARKEAIISFKKNIEQSCKSVVSASLAVLANMSITLDHVYATRSFLVTLVRDENKSDGEQDIITDALCQALVESGGLVILLSLLDLSVFESNSTDNSNHESDIVKLCLYLITRGLAREKFWANQEITEKSEETGEMIKKIISKPDPNFGPNSSTWAPLLASSASYIRYQLNASNALHASVISGKEEISNALLSVGAQANVTDGFGSTPLMTALLYGRAKIVNLLLKSGASVDAINFKGDNVLKHAFLACEDSDVKTSLQGKVVSKVTVKSNGSFIKTILESGADVNVSDSKGQFPLHWALSKVSADNIVYGNKSVSLEFSPPSILPTFYLLLQFGISLDKCDKLGRSALHLAFMYGNCEIANELLRLGTNPNVLDINGNLPLHIACAAHGSENDKEKSYDLVVKLIDSGAGKPIVTGAHVDRRKGLTKEQKVVLELENIFEDALGNILCPQSVRETPASKSTLANYVNRMELTPLLVSCGAVCPFLNERGLKGCDENILTALLLKSSVNGGGVRKRIATYLISTLKVTSNIRTNEGLTALHCACASYILGDSASGNQLIALLINQGLLSKDDVDFQSRTGSGGDRFAPIHYGIATKSEALLNTLMSLNVNVNPATSNPPPLILAIQTGVSDTVIDYLLKDNDVNIRGLGYKEGRRKYTSTPLLLASENNNLSVVEKLLKNPKIDLNSIRPHNGRCSLSIACFRGYDEIVKCLINAGASTDILDVDKKSSLESAIEGKNVKAVQYLIDAKKNSSQDYQISQSVVTLSEMENINSFKSYESLVAAHGKEEETKEYIEVLNNAKKSGDIVRIILNNCDVEKYTHENDCFLEKQAFGKF